jgi:2-polyprenyl-6-hydroxyphenyl methylase/3-demethylubiquinone-9 3-methyltransferase
VPSRDTTALETHFKFGENWQSFTQEVDEARIAKAVTDLAAFMAPESLEGKSFLDIGCGSGLSMLAALRLGAASVHGTDLDPNSVEAARSLLTRLVPSGSTWTVEQRSVFDLDPQQGHFDVVYSWGVLHHTGAMWRAVACAARMVAPNGILAIALYRKTPLCGLWRIEKRFYTQAPAVIQAAIRTIFKIAYIVGLLAQRRNPLRYIANYPSARGMSWHHDVHDWLGGYPYESVLPPEVKTHLEADGFAVTKVKETAAPMAGLFGTGCDEFLARRSTGT